MNNFIRFLIKVVLYSVLAILIIAYPIWHLLGETSFWSVFFGCWVGAFNIILAYIFNQRALNKSSGVLLKSILFGMSIRLLVVAAATVYCAKFTELKLIEFIVALLIYYMFLQIFEVRYIQTLLISGKQK